jgi:hypothetical protein
MRSISVDTFLADMYPYMINVWVNYGEPNR